MKRKREKEKMKEKKAISKGTVMAISHVALKELKQAAVISPPFNSNNKKWIYLSIMIVYPRIGSMHDYVASVYRDKENLYMYICR